MGKKTEEAKERYKEQKRQTLAIYENIRRRDLKDSKGKPVIETGEWVETSRGRVFMPSNKPSGSRGSYSSEESEFNPKNPLEREWIDKLRSIDLTTSAARKAGEQFLKRHDKEIPGSTMEEKREWLVATADYFEPHLMELLKGSFKAGV